MLTTDEMIEAVRQQIDEDSDSDIKDTHILSSLNRALFQGMDTLIGAYPDPVITYREVAVEEDGTVAVPVDSFQGKVVHIDVMISDIPNRVMPGTFEDLSKFEFATVTDLPEVWAVLKDRIHFRPTTAAGTTVRVWFADQVQKLVKPQGRISRLGSDYVVVDSYGEGLTTDIDKLNSFFNVIDFNTGKVKWTGQVKTIVANKITHKTSVSRTEVLNETVGTAFASASPDIRQDDYICEASGTCIPYMPQPLENYVIQAAVVELKNRLGLDSIPDRAILSGYMKTLKDQWKGRPCRTRIHLLTPTWDRGRTSKGPWR